MSGDVKKELVWQIREMGGQGQALLYSYDPASRAGPPDSRSRRRRAPGRTSPAPTIPAASSGAPLLAMGRSLHQGPTGQAQLRARSLDAGLWIPWDTWGGGIFRARTQRKETDPTGASTHVTPAPLGRPPSPPRVPTPLPAEVPHAVEDHLQALQPHGAAVHCAPKRDTPRSPGAGGCGHPAPPHAARRARRPPRTTPPPPAAPPAGGPGLCVPARPSPRAARGAGLCSSRSYSVPVHPHPQRLPRPLSNLRLLLAARTSAPSRGDAGARHSTLETHRIRVGSPLRREVPRRQKSSPDSPRRECREPGVWPGGNRNLASSEWHALYPSLSNLHVLVDCSTWF